MKNAWRTGKRINGPRDTYKWEWLGRGHANAGKGNKTRNGNGNEKKTHCARLPKIKAARTYGGAAATVRGGLGLLNGKERGRAGLAARAQNPI